MNGNEEPKIVRPTAFVGMSHSWNLNFFSGPKFTIQCGSCGFTFTKRLPLIDAPTVRCDYCNVLNRIPVVCE